MLSICVYIWICVLHLLCSKLLRELTHLAATSAYSAAPYIRVCNIERDGGNGFRARNSFCPQNNSAHTHTHTTTTTLIHLLTRYIYIYITIVC